MLFDRVVAYVNSRGPILIQTPWTGAIGNCAEEIYFGLLKARREGKRVCFLFPKDIKDRRGWFRFSNRKRNAELFQVCSPYRVLAEDRLIVVVLEWILSFTYYFFRLLSALLTFGSRRLIGKNLTLPGGFPSSYLIPTLGQAHLWRPAGSRRFDRTVVRQFEWEKEFATYLPVSLRLTDEAQGKLMGQIGLPSNAWFVCLHVREGGFYNDGVEAYMRNASIRNYFKAIKVITDRGGWVVRLGDPTMTKLPEMELVIDYAHSQQKSDFMDLYLIKECNLYIGMQSGILDVAALFQKPMLIPNMHEWLFNYPQRRGDLGILRHIFSTSDNRFLSIQELLTLSNRRVLVSHHCEDDADLVYHENSEDEICALVEEYYGSTRDRELSVLQREFESRRIEAVYRVLEGPTVWPKAADVHNKFRFASRLEGCKGTIADGFLRANWDVSSQNGSRSRDSGKCGRQLPFIGRSTRQ
jgi:putative glycosyltransferase (TIGR04372 family)